ncbi:MAG: peptidase S41 [Planctomycetota bacterium]|nr:MAG: peptidase S41 [Planctomycetota bacterium]
MAETDWACSLEYCMLTRTAHWVLRAAAVCLITAGSITQTRATASVLARDAAADFDEAWHFIRDHYCFFPEHGIDAWRRTRDALLPVAERASTLTARIRVLEELLDQLADPHAHLRTNLASSHRLVPHDVWGTRTPEGLRIDAVRAGSAASRAGVLPGDIVLQINGAPALEVADRWRPQHSPMDDRALDSWSALVGLAGTHDTPRVWRVRSGAMIRTIKIDTIDDDAGAHSSGASPAVTVSEPAPGVGLIRVASFADPHAVELFDAAVDRLADASAIIIDVRNNHGGDTAVARPMMGRFVRVRTPYAKMRRRNGDGLGAPWTEYVEPRGRAYTGRVVILVDRFSASMAEGFAMGMRTIAHASIVGTRMAGLGAAIGTTTLPNSKITLQISTEPVYTVDGQPRWELAPDVEVPLDALRRAQMTGGDAILDAGLHEALR